VIIAGVIWFFVWKSKQKQKQRDRQSAAGRVIHSRKQQRSQQVGVSLLKQSDPNFSRVLFIDFAHLVYVKLHESRGGLARRNPEQFGVAPYLSPEVRAQVKAADVKVTEVVVGALHLERVSASKEFVHVAVRIKANVVENGRRLYLLQRLNFRRPKGVTTRPPEKVLDLGCPNCGSPEEPGVDGRCPSCGSVTGRGEMDWQVVSIETHDRKEVGPPVGHSGGVEVGTDLPTVFAPDLAAQKRALAMRDPSFSWQAYNMRLQHMFKEIQAGWSRLDESRLRPYETDTVFDAHRFWLQRYRESGTRNILADVRILRIDIAKIEHDAYFDAITTRIFASMKDSTVDAAGKVISGSAKAERRFSEYWTTIRRSGTHKKSGAPRACPNCGAPLDKITMAGVCEYCGGKVVSGEFDWVLAIIEQDEEYAG
jgi:rubrerythrin